MKSSQPNFKLCEICDIEATCLCNTCKLYYCDDCFKYVHDKKTKNNHNKNKIDYFVPIETKCHDHPQHPMDLFCLDEKGNIIIYNIYFILQNFVVLTAII